MENDNAVYPQYKGYDLQYMDGTNTNKDSSDFRALK